MRYKAGRIGRVVLARFEHGEAVVPALSTLCTKEGISSGWFFLFGAVRGGKLVAGPKDSTLPPDPVWREFADPFEIVGMGSIAERDGRPSVHLHASLGRGNEVLTGCIRREGEAFIVVEAMILEILGVGATRAVDDRFGLELLDLE